MPGKKAAHTKKTPVKAYNRTAHDGKKSGGTVKIKWVVSFISCTADMRQTIRGRGLGSKLRKTAGSGNKGQKSRRGYSRRRGFEGGQMPLHRRMPKRGFHNPFGVTYSVVNLAELNVFPAGETVTPELLRAHGFVRRATDPIKVLGDGELTTKLAIHAQAFSASAKEKITKAGGTFEVVA